MQLSGRQIDDWGVVALTESGLHDLIYRGVDISGLTAVDSEDVRKYNSLCKELDHPQDALVLYETPAQSVQEWDREHQAQWFIPEPFDSVDVLDWLILKCSTDEQRLRVIEEWQLFEERGMENVLRFLIYLIHYFRENGILWGVGRGSSVSSYALYLIGVHKVDSMLFQLDVREFLK